MKNYKELNVWKKGIEIVKAIYQLSKQFPKEEKYAMIAEGSSRNSDKDYARFLQIALGSAFELQTYLVITKEMKWAKLDDIIDTEKILEEEIKMIHGFLRKIANG